MKNAQPESQVHLKIKQPGNGIERPLRVCYFGTYRAGYSRNKIMIAALRSANVEVIECHETLWHGIEDRVDATTGGWVKPGFWWRVIRTYARLVKRYFTLNKFDILVVGYPGQLDVFLARVLSWLHHKPLVWDIFMSIYLIAIERGLDQKSKFTVEGLRVLERAACRLPDLLILDTSEYVGWFNTIHAVPSSRFKLVPTGADDQIFHPLPHLDEHNGSFIVLYYGTFTPNHGVLFIIEAAHLLQDGPHIQFELVGTGPERQEAQALAKKYGLQNVSFIDWLEKDELVKHIAQADVCLGAFGLTPQSVMTVQNKIYEGLAMAKPVITGDSPVIRQTMEHGKHIYLCNRADPESLAEAIRTLLASPELRRTLSQNGYRLFSDNFNIIKLGERYRQHLQKFIP